MYLVLQFVTKISFLKTKIFLRSSFTKLSALFSKYFFKPEISFKADTIKVNNSQGFYKLTFRHQYLLYIPNFNPKHMTTLSNIFKFIIPFSFGQILFQKCIFQVAGNKGNLSIFICLVHSLLVGFYNATIRIIRNNHKINK